MFGDILNLLKINSYAVTSSPFVSVDKDFIRREEKRVRIARVTLKLFVLLLLSIVIAAQGLIFLSSFSSNVFSVIFGILDLLFGVSGIIWFTFLLESSVEDLYKIRRRKR